MAIITEQFGSGGANVAPGGSAGKPSLAQALRDVADDLTDLQPPVIATPDAGGTYGANEQALLNEIKTVLNTLAAAVIRTQKG